MCTAADEWKCLRIGIVRSAHAPTLFRLNTHYFYIIIFSIFSLFTINISFISILYKIFCIQFATAPVGGLRAPCFRFNGNVCRRLCACASVREEKRILFRGWCCCIPFCRRLTSSSTHDIRSILLFNFITHKRNSLDPLNWKQTKKKEERNMKQQQSAATNNNNAEQQQHQRPTTTSNSGIYRNTPAGLNFDISYTSTYSNPCRYKTYIYLYMIS